MLQDDKRIDESWKDAIEKEKTTAKDRKDTDEANVPEPDFSFFLTTLALQASIFLGEMPNPSNNQKEENLAQAKFIIDTLNMLKDKTAGNLSTDEDSLLDNVLYDLRMKYIGKVEKRKE